ncbi:hypothetical protein [Cronobacter condimenti]|uniref:hypothetical protein n=1 Tax=Cronobacter condimenti TaxID=1163710 RepID=UPI0006ACFADB
MCQPVCVDKRRFLTKPKPLAFIRQKNINPWPQPVNELDRQLARAGLARQLAFICTDDAQLPAALREAPLLAVVPWPWYATLKNNAQLHQLELDDEKALGSFFCNTERPPWHGKNA